LHYSEKCGTPRAFMWNSKSIYVGLQEHLCGTPIVFMWHSKSIYMGLQEHGGVRGEVRFPPFKDILPNKNIDIKW